METISALLAICAGNSPVNGEFPTQRPVTRTFDVFFHLRLNKQLSKQSWGWWFETLSCPLWCHCNVSTCSCKDQLIELRIQEIYRQSAEARCQVDNKDVVGTAPAEVWLILEVWRYRIKIHVCPEKYVWTVSVWGTLCVGPAAVIIHCRKIYRQVSNIRRTTSRHLKDSRTVLRPSLPNPLKPDAKSRMKM